MFYMCLSFCSQWGGGLPTSGICICLEGGLHLGVGGLHPGGLGRPPGSASKVGGVCIQGVPPRTRKVGSMHPTEILSCLDSISFVIENSADKKAFLRIRTACFYGSRVCMFC